MVNTKHIPIIPLNKHGAIPNRVSTKKYALNFPETVHVEDVEVCDIIETSQNNFEKNVRYVKAWVFYCDSIPWDGAEDTMDTSGDGSAENPWRNLQYAIDKLSCYIDFTCSNYVFCLRISGVVNYIFRCSPARNCLILDGQNLDGVFTNPNNGVYNITLFNCYLCRCKFNYIFINNTITSYQGVVTVRDFVTVYNCTINIVYKRDYITSSGCGFSGGDISSRNSVIIDSTVSVVDETGALSQNEGGFDGAGFVIYGCTYTYKCTATKPYVHGFTGIIIGFGIYSRTRLINCVVDINYNNGVNGRHFIGYGKISETFSAVHSYLSNCICNIKGGQYVDGVANLGGTSIVENCDINCIAVEPDDPTTGTRAHLTYSCGCRHCYNTTFINCKVNASVITKHNAIQGRPLYSACAFRANLTPLIYNCSISPAMCDGVSFHLSDRYDCSRYKCDI